MAGDKVKVDPDLVAGLGNTMLSMSVRLSSKPSSVGQSTIEGLGKAGEGCRLDATYAQVTQTVMDACDAVTGSIETNATRSTRTRSRFDETQSGRR